MARRLAAALVTSLAAGASGCAAAHPSTTTTATTSATSTAAATAPAAAAGRVLDGEHRGPAGARRYELYVPSTGAAGGRPLVVMLHGCTQTAADFARGTRMNALAETAGALVLYPEQPATANPQRCWNWYDPAHQGRDAGEPAILAAMTREVAAAHGADPRRIYVAGVSAGGAMALALAANFPTLYAAAGVHSAVPYAAARDVGGAVAAMRAGGAGDPAAVTRAMGAARRTVPLVVFHGTADAVVSPANGRAIATQWSGAAGLAPLAEEAPFSSRAESARDYSVLHYGEGRPAPVQLWLIEGLGHAWSGGSPDGTYTDPRGPDASRELLDFLLAHRLPEAR